MPKLRLIFYIYELPPMGGGVAQAGLSLLNEFSRKSNLELDVITTSLQGRAETVSFSPNITIHYLNLGNRIHRLQNQSARDMISFSWEAYWQTWKLIRSGKRYHLTHFFGYPGGLVSLLFAWKFPYIISLRGADVPGYNQKFWLWYLPYRVLTWLIWPLAKVRITNSQWLKQLARKNLKLDYQIIPNGVDTKLFAPVLKTKKFKSFTITSGGTVLGPKKNIDVLIRGFAKFHHHHADSRLLIIGDGPNKDSLESLVSDLDLNKSVLFVGRKDRAWLSKNLPKCHLFCLPSSAEGMSNALLEAMACGLPIITTLPSKELINDNGVVVKNPTPENLAKEFEKLYLDKKLRIKMGVKSREIAEGMSWAKVAGEYNKFYLRLK